MEMKKTYKLNHTIKKTIGCYKVRLDNGFIIYCESVKDVLRVLEC